MRKGGRRTLIRIAGLLVLGLLMGGCDRCGDWWGKPDDSLSCRNR